MTRLRSCAFVAILTAIPVLAGCGGEPLGRVKGTVTLDDKPLPNGTLTFETAGKRPATAKIENGQIVEVTTFQLGDGLPIGTHKIAVSSTEAPASAVNVNPGDSKAAPPPNYMSGKSLIPARYNNPETSGLKAEITTGENTIELKLTSK